jgi:hypothetical protein
VAFHGDVWLVTGAAAPVVALAVVVSLNDLLKEGVISLADAMGLLRFFPPARAIAKSVPLRGLADVFSGLATIVEESAKLIKWLIYCIVLAGPVNLILQAALFFVSLGSLQSNANWVPPWVAIVAAVGGLLLLAFGSLGAVLLGAVLKLSLVGVRVLLEQAPRKKGLPSSDDATPPMPPPEPSTQP